MGQANQNIVGKRVKEARAKAQPRITQEELSKRLSKLGVSIDRAGIAKIEGGLRGVLDYEVVALAKALAASTTWLLGEKEK